MEDDIEFDYQAIGTILTAADLRDQAHIIGPVDWWLAMVYAKRHLGLETRQPVRCRAANVESETEDELD